jgi:hypothetical protein
MPCARPFAMPLKEGDETDFAFRRIFARGQRRPSAPAVRLEHQAWTEPYKSSNPDRQIKLMKLALQAQRQAAQTLCSIAALNKEDVRPGIKARVRQRAGSSARYALGPIHS